MNIVTKSLLIALFPASSSFCQEFAQDLTADEVLLGGSNLNFLLDGNLKEMANISETELIVFRFSASPRYAKFIWIRKKIEVSHDPFERNEKALGKVFTTGLLSDEISDHKKDWLVFSDVGLIERCEAVCAKSNDQEINLALNMKSHETYVYIFVRRDRKFKAGMIVNPVEGTRTYKLMLEIDKMLLSPEKE